MFNAFANKVYKIEWFNLYFSADCPSGTHSSSSGKCVLCNKGNYQDETGQTSCKSCPYGKTTAFVGSQSQLDCSGITF